MKPCPICLLSDQQIDYQTVEGSLTRINCPRCKSFFISFNALNEELNPLRAKLSAWIRNRNEQGGEVPQITTDTLKNLQSGLPDYSPREKQTILLHNIERKTEYPGNPVVLTYNYDYPLAWASGVEELVYYINSLQERGFVNTNMTMGLCRVTITAGGWDYLERLEKHINERTQAFVAMSFSDDLKPIWEGPIYNAITKAGYKPYRVDAEPHIDRIDAKIISEIKNSRFVVADVTDQKRGVYFEAGFAQGLGLPVIWCVRKDDLENVHFDTRQYNHIVWESPDDLEDKLYYSICANIGKGANSS
jgi:hypothetical protein